MGNVNHVRNGSNGIKEKTRVGDALTIKEEKKHRNPKYFVKILIVGTSSCGKSTIAKQLRILYGNPFSEEQRKDYKKILIFNMCYAMKELISRAKEMNLDFEDKFLVENVEKLDALETQLTQSNIDDIINLWRDKALQTTYGRRNEYDLPSNLEYCISRGHNLIDPDYQVTDEDVLNARQRTTGIVETEFQIGKFTWNLIDVGGQRAERRKWAHFYEGAVAIIYVAALDDWDVVLQEDVTKTRMQESIDVFDSMINHQWFARTPWILFLNKKDLFSNKIKTTDMSKTFSDYKGGRSNDNGAKFIEGLYLKCLKSRNTQSLYVHFTCALDTQQVKFVFNSVAEWIFKQRVAMSGI